ncbi:hypothetical protein INR49_004443 [Caranx melampygus]|nr:hypothetical protein INR49_004443 [Caranx melampygus]
MISTFEQLNRDILDKLFPPAARRLFGSPLLNIELTEAAGQLIAAWAPGRRRQLPPDAGARVSSSAALLSRLARGYCHQSQELPFRAPMPKRAGGVSAKGCSVLTKTLPDIVDIVALLSDSSPSERASSCS